MSNNQTSPDNQNSHLPKGWVLTTLREVILSTRSKVMPDNFPHLEYVGMEHIEAHSMKLLGSVPASTMRSQAVHFFPHDVFYGRLRPYLNKVYSPEFEGLCSSEFIVFAESKNLLSKFLKYFLNRLEFVSFASRLNEGDRPRVDFSQISVFPFALPPLPEQERIVLKIEELFTKLDAGVAELKQAQAQIKRYRQAVLKSAFEGKLTNENSGEEKSLNEWEWTKIGEVCKTIDGDRGSNYPKKNEFSDKGYCLFLSTKNVRDGRFVFEENIFITKQKDEILRGGKLELNDVVITTRGTLGNVALYDEKIPFKHIRINSGMLILRVTNRNLNNHFLMKFITSPIFINQLKAKQTGTAQPQIPANILREIEIPFGSLEEQIKIVEEVERLLSVADAVEKTIAESLKQAERLRQSILQKAFTGKLVPQDERDEPASVLLERIKKEREEENKQKTVKIKAVNRKLKKKDQKPKTKEATQGIV